MDDLEAWPEPVDWREFAARRNLIVDFWDLPIGLAGLVAVMPDGRGGIAVNSQLEPYPAGTRVTVLHECAHVDLHAGRLLEGPLECHIDRIHIARAEVQCERLVADWCLSLDLVKRFLRGYGRIDVDAGDDETLATITGTPISWVRWRLADNERRELHRGSNAWGHGAASLGPRIIGKD